MNIEIVNILLDIFISVLYNLEFNANDNGKGLKEIFG